MKVTNCHTIRPSDRQERVIDLQGNLVRIAGSSGIEQEELMTLRCGMQTLCTIDTGGETFNRILLHSGTDKPLDSIINSQILAFYPCNPKKYWLSRVIDSIQ